MIPATGAYAERAARLAREIGCEVQALRVRADEAASPDALAAALAADPAVSHVILVYSETGTGVVHDVAALAQAAARTGRRVIIDAVSAFGALPLDLSALPMVDAVVFTANKCIEGLPGLAFAVARVDRLVACQGRAGSWSLDLADIYQHALRVGWGSFRFTPPAQALAAFNVALDLFEAEGGQPARLARYTANMQALYEGVLDLGLRPCLPPPVQGPIVVNVYAPDHPAWDLQAFVDAGEAAGVRDQQFLQPPRSRASASAASAPITPDDMRAAVAAMGEALAALGIPGAPGRVMRSDLEIADAAVLQPIAEIAQRAGIPADALESYGRFKAKVGFDFIRSLEGRPDGALVLVTGISPTPGGRGQDDPPRSASAMRCAGRGSRR